MTADQLILCRILDANLDRAREGLRVVEEWCRFGLNHGGATEQCKSLRQALGQWHRPEFRQARNTPADLGTQLTHDQEHARLDLTDVLQVNLARVQEALRVLEEYGKLYNVTMAAEVKQMRYQVYALESQLLRSPRQQKLLNARLYLVTSPRENLLETVEAALQGGLMLVQYRDKEAADQQRLALAQQLRQLCRQYGALFIVNDRVDIALAVDADGVHLGQQDISIALARQVLGPQRLVGRSTTNAAELAGAIAQGADYVGVGPVYATPTKAGRAPAGLDYVRYAAQQAPMPWYAIGGIDAQNLGEVMAAGAQRVAVVRALMNASDPQGTTQQLLSQVQSSSQQAVAIPGI
nr:thiamine phosphate synthase [Petrachloros mirabilis]